MFFKSKTLFILTFNAAKIQKTSNNNNFFHEKVVLISTKYSYLRICAILTTINAGADIVFFFL